MWRNGSIMGPCEGLGVGAWRLVLWVTTIRLPRRPLPEQLSSCLKRGRTGPGERGLLASAGVFDEDPVGSGNW